MRSSAARVFWASFALASVVFHLGLVFSGLVPNLVSRPVHLVFVLPWVLVRGRAGGALWSGLVLAALGIGGALWVTLNHDALGDQYGFLEGRGQIAIAVTLILVVLEAARRAIGWPLPVVAALALAYALLGQYIPGRFGHAGTPIESFLGTLTIAEGGLWGKLTSVSVNVVAVFVIFGAVLNAGEAGQGFMNLAAAAAGRLKGGAAKVSILSSALFGSISGSASANVASTGAITLPAMDRLGYPRRIAGAVEAVASSGGQIMPPLMGAGAFVMVELTGVPYTGIIAAAALPALLYFWAAWIGIDGYARRFDLRGLDAADRPAPRDVATTAAFFLVPFAVLLWGMFALGVTPQYAACLAIFAGAALLPLGADMRVDAGRTRDRAERALLAAGQQVALIGSIIFCASLVIGVLGVTGLGVKLTSLILSASGGLLWPSLLLTALACLVLGMEVPTTAAYVICVSVAGPALIELGLAPLQAHLFVFWFALLSTITPPVCGAVFIAAGMVGENWLKVAVAAMALGLGLYVIPLGMAAQPALLALSSDPWAALGAMAWLGAALALLSFAIIAPGGAARRLALGAAAAGVFALGL
ncbi:MAG: TRAP transporter fused permease subunit [Roseovarius sp.]|nr:TRAP transporter fused permease subunit [Roseovarius sp.]